MKKKYWEMLDVELDKKLILFVGEIHGVAGNTKIIDSLVRYLKIDTLTVELETRLGDGFFSGSEALGRLKKAIAQEKWLVESGIVGQEHLVLFKRLVKSGKKIIPVKIDNQDWNKAEAQTARYIIDYSKRHPRERLLVVVGKLHARNKIFPYFVGGQRKLLLPLGARLKKSTNLQLRYRKGEAYNFRTIKLKERPPFPMREGLCLYPSRSKFFSWDLWLPEATPITKIR